MKWRLFGLTAASIAALLVIRTGKPLLDLAFGVGGVVLSQVTVESQRWLSAVVDVSMRKRLIRSIVIAARLAVLLSGCTFFLGIAAPSPAPCYARRCCWRPLCTSFQR
jgi:hypothetical protein